MRSADFSDVIAEADKRLKSWREKLEWISELLDDDNNMPDMDRLAYLSIYLRFLGSGKTSTCEDGRHFRPSNHAGAAQKIEKSLCSIADPSNIFIIRKIYPSLPSYDNAFLRAEPLTRIRDIAHRNDIPQELKQEIKHTLQNKLHRCAGPEDLATSASILKRITSPGATYSSAFVEEFRIFHEELKDFFNAQGLDERLEAMIGGKDVDSDLIREFLSSKRDNDGSAGRLLALLERLTLLRSRFFERDRGEASSDEQQTRLADIGLENFAFAVLSSLINLFDLPDGTTPDWMPMLQALALTMENIRLSGTEPEECVAIHNGLHVAAAEFDAGEREKLLALKAALDRCLRLSEGYCDRILALFPERVVKLGTKLGVDENAIRFFSEGEVRGNLAFQLSKLVTHLLKIVRKYAGLPYWDPVVTGAARGRFVVSDSMSGSFDENGILLLKKAAGDEEIPKGVAGVVLGSGLPHLSHLGVRARQAGVVVAVCEDAERFADLMKLSGEYVALDVTADAVSIEVSGQESRGLENKEIRKSAAEPEVSPEYECSLCDPGSLSVRSAGGKAFSAALIERLSDGGRAGFMTPVGLVIPFGIMEDSFHSLPELKNEYQELIGRLDELPQNDLENSLVHLRDLIRKLPIPGDVLERVAGRFGRNARLMVRSSSNCEDTKELAGAGLYDSVANVSPPHVGDAVREVWASLWTKRAVISRRQSGIPHDRAHMAVLVQEMLRPDISFIMHTVNPIDLNAREVYIELAVGLGETLASAAEKGSPYRIVCNKDTGAIKMLSFASFSHALYVDDAKGMTRKTIDYSEIRLSRDPAFRNELGGRLAAIAEIVEEAFECPQDIEGAVVGDEIYLVQSRPQQGRGLSLFTDKVERSRRIGTVPCRDPKMFALFQKRIDGDDALLQLAAVRFGQAGLGAEFYADTPDELDWLLRFKPSGGSPAAVHLSRGIDLFREDSLRLLTDFASRFAGRIFGMVVHDQAEIPARFEDYVAAVGEIGRRLKGIENSPYLFIEYAVFLEPETYLEVFKSTSEVERVSACLDVGHVGIKHIRDAYFEKHSGEDICGIKPYDPKLPEVIEDVQEAVGSALPAALTLIRELGRIGKPVHFHLHDGHPLSTFSPFGVSDHLSFFQEIPIPFEHGGRRRLPGMYGPSGLFEIVKTALKTLGPEFASFSLEIHPVEGREPLGEGSDLFSHWTDRTNAEKMNHWISTLLKNHRLLIEACAREPEE